MSSGQGDGKVALSEVHYSRIPFGFWQHSVSARPRAEWAILVEGLAASTHAPRRCGAGGVHLDRLAEEHCVFVELPDLGEGGGERIDVISPCRPSVRSAACMASACDRQWAVAMERRGGQSGEHPGQAVQNAGILGRPSGEPLR